MNATIESAKTTPSSSVGAVQLRRTPPERFADELKSRIVLCRNTERSNCMGTAMYLIGEQKEDSYLDICCKNREMLARMTLIPRPAKAAVAMWYKRTPKFLIEHMGIIVSLEPLLVTHRLDWQESFVENEPFLKLDPRYRAGPDGRDVKLAFYIPKSCESLDFNGISLMAEIPEKSHFLTRILRKIIP